MASGVTPELGLPYPVSSDPTNVAGDDQSLADALDNTVVTGGQGTQNARPNPGKPRQVWYSSDTATFSYWNGTGWISLGPINTTGAQITTSAPGDTQNAGVTGLTADAGHRHGREQTVISGNGDIAPLRTYQETLVTITNPGATATLDLSIGREYTVTLNTPVTFSLANVPATAGVRVTIGLKVTQGGSGTNTVTWWSGVRWGQQGVPALSAAVGNSDYLAFVTDDGGTTWLGFLGGVGY